MEATNSPYDFEASKARIDEILLSANSSYQESTGVPARTSLTFLNGYYVDVTVIFVDLRESTALADKHNRPVLAKIYRSYISEVVAVMRGDTTISEIYIEGDGVWGVFNTTTIAQVNRAFETAARIASLIDTLNIKLNSAGYSTIEAGIGMDDGTSLYIKAGHKGSSINEVVWIGRVVGQAAGLCKDAGRTSRDNRVMVSERIYKFLEDRYKAFFNWSSAYGCYEGDVINVHMNQWVNENA